MAVGLSDEPLQRWDGNHDEETCKWINKTGDFVIIVENPNNHWDIHLDKIEGEGKMRYNVVEKRESDRKIARAIVEELARNPRHFLEKN
jgi:hypothetical protein